MSLTNGINVTSDTNPNYEITYFQGMLSVTPAPLRIGVADAQRLYGRVNPDFAIDFVDGLKLSDMLGNLGLSFSTTATGASDVGIYNIDATGVTNANYALDAIEPGILTIDPAPIDLTVSDVVRTYGESNPDIIGFSVAGLALGDEPEDVVSIFNPATVTSDAGEYELVPQVNDGNYVLDRTTGGLFTVIVRNIALKPENVVRLFGDADPAFTILVAGDGLAPFDTLEDVALDSVIIDGTFGRQADVGLRPIRIQSLVDNPNYSVILRQGVYAVLPRPIEIKVNDADAFGNQPLPRFSLSIDNLPDFESAEGAFPNVRYRIFNTDEPAPVQIPIVPEDFIVPVGFVDAEFFADYPSSIINAGIVFPPGNNNNTPVFDVTLVTSVVVEGTILVPNAVVEIGLTIISSTLFSTGQNESDEGAIQYVQAQASNPNYVITRSRNGILAWAPDPEVATKLREIEAERSLYQENYDRFWNPNEGSNLGSGSGFLRLPEDALPTILAALGG